MTESKAATASSPQPQPQPQPKPAKRVMRSQGEWKALLEAFNNSGLTKAAFCKQHRIATSSLYRWQSFFPNTPATPILSMSPSHSLLPRRRQLLNATTLGKSSWRWATVSYCVCVPPDVLP